MTTTAMSVTMMMKRLHLPLSNPDHAASSPSRAVSSSGPVVAATPTNSSLHADQQNQSTIVVSPREYEEEDESGLLTNRSNVMYTPRGTVVRSNVPNSRLYRPVKRNFLEPEMLSNGGDDSCMNTSTTMINRPSTVNNFSVSEMSVVASSMYSNVVDDDGEGDDHSAANSLLWHSSSSSNSNRNNDTNEDELEEYREEELLLMKDFSLEGEDIFLIHDNARRYITVNPERLYIRFQHPGTFNRYSSMVNIDCDLRERERRIYYYEIQVLRCKNNAKMVVGFSHRDTYQYAIPGRDGNSVGYHSDTGMIAYGASHRFVAPPFQEGDYIGCGIALPHRHVFFTHNGHYLGKLFALDSVESTGSTAEQQQYRGARETSSDLRYVPRVGIVKVLQSDGNDGIISAEIQIKEKRGKRLSKDIVARFTTPKSRRVAGNGTTVSPVVYSNSPAVLEVNIGQCPFKFDVSSLDIDTGVDFATINKVRLTRRQRVLQQHSSMDDYRTELNRRIMSACAKGNMELLDDLLPQYPGDINTIETSDHCFLPHIAIMNSNENTYDTLRTLKKFGIDIDVISPTQGTPLHAAVRFNHIEAVICLLELGANYDLKWRGKSPINTVYRISNICSHRSSYDDRKMIELINILRGAGSTLDIHTASFIGDVHGVQDSIDLYGEYIDSQDRYRRTALHIATHRGHRDIVQYLLRRGAGIDIDLLIPSSFIIAALNYDLDTIRDMSTSGRANMNNSFLRHHILEILMEHERPDLTTEVDRTMKYHTMRLLCELGSDPTAYYTRPSLAIYSFKSALLLSIEKQNYELFELFCLYGRSIRRIRGPNDESVLHMIIQQYTGSRDTTLLKMAKKLLESAAIDIENDMTENGNTVLHTAAFLGKNQLVKLLLHQLQQQYRSSSVNDWNLDGMSPLMMAVMNNQVETAKLLVKVGGAKPNAVNSAGETVLHVLYGDQRLLPLKRKCLYEVRSTTSNATLNATSTSTMMMADTDVTPPYDTYNHQHYNQQHYQQNGSSAISCDYRYRPLDSATRLALAQFCIEKLGVNPDIKDKKGRTAKSLAVVNGVIRDYPSRIKHTVPYR